MEGQSTLDAIARQRAVRDTSLARPPLNVQPSSTPSSLLKLEPDGSVWIGGIKYQPAQITQPAQNLATASIATTEVEAAMTAANLGENEDWATSNNDSTWGNNKLLDTAKFLLAATTPSLPASIHKDLPLYLDSGRLLIFLASALTFPPTNLSSHEQSQALVICRYPPLG